MIDQKPSDELPDDEATERMNRALKRALSTPPQPKKKEAAGTGKARDSRSAPATAKAKPRSAG